MNIIQMENIYLEPFKTNNITQITYLIKTFEYLLSIQKKNEKYQVVNKYIVWYVFHYYI